jgi:hypothetical protein
MQPIGFTCSPCDDQHGWGSGSRKHQREQSGIGSQLEQANREPEQASLRTGSVLRVRQASPSVRRNPDPGQLGKSGSLHSLGPSLGWITDSG